jgi:hypothetical protein
MPLVWDRTCQRGRRGRDDPPKPSRMLMRNGSCSPQQHSVDMQEVAGQDAGCLDVRNCRQVGDARRGAGPNPAAARIRRIVLPPPGAPSRAAHPGCAGTPARVLPRQLLHQRPHPGWHRRSAWRVQVGPFPADQGDGARSARCPASRSGSAAAARAAAPSSGQRARRGQPVRPRCATCRPSTATSCRRTKISASFAASLGASSTSQPNTRMMNR